jgi:hypothetical protein
VNTEILRERSDKRLLRRINCRLKLNIKMGQKEAGIGSMHSIELVVLVVCVESIRFWHVAADIQKDELFQTSASAG